MHVQKPLFDVPSDWRLPRLANLPRWPRYGRVAVDLETCDPYLTTLGPGVRRGGYICGVAIAIEDGPSLYLPIQHATGPNLDRAVVLQYLRDQATEFRGTVVGMNLPYDLDYLAEAGVVFGSAAWFRDVGVAAVLINDLHTRYSLNHLLRRAGLPPKSEDGLHRAARAWCLDPKAEMWKLPARHVGPYALGDVELPLALLRRQERELEDQGLGQIWDLESKVLPITVKIRRRGVRIDLDRLDQVERWALGKQIEALKQVKHSTGVEIPVEHVHKKDLIAAAVEATGARLPKTPTGQPKTDAATLEGLDHDVPRAIIRARKFDKLITTFAASIRKHEINGRIHATFRAVKGQTGRGDEEKGVAFGRFSSTDPNLQQQYNPKKEPEISGQWRRIFLPDEGATWAACDYSAQEPRLIVHYAHLTKCEGAAQMVDRYRVNPRLDLHSQTAALCAEAFTGLGFEPDRHRGLAKIIFLGLCYGMGQAKLCRSLGLPTETELIHGEAREVAGREGQAVLDGFHRMVPFVAQLAEKARRGAQTRGRIRTLLGRLCRFPRDLKRPTRYDWTHKALNRLIQGSAADQGKQALIDADAAGIRVQIPVHDELCASVADQTEAETLGQLMENAVELEVPTVVDIETGPSWGEAK